MSLDGTGFPWLMSILTTNAVVSAAPSKFC